jgi:L-amino acid N-acyltransferase YncA
MCPEWTPWEVRDRDVDADNAASLVFDERLGFVGVAHFREVRFTFRRS